MRPPKTVVAYALEVAVVLAVLLVAGGDRHELLYSPLLIAPTIGLVYGLWVAWLFLTIVAVAGSGDGLYPELEGWTLVINGSMLALLLAPPTWRYARRGRPRFLLRRG